MRNIANVVSRETGTAGSNPALSAFVHTASRNSLFCNELRDVIFDCLTLWDNQWDKKRLELRLLPSKSCFYLPLKHLRFLTLEVICDEQPLSIDSKSLGCKQ